MHYRIEIITKYRLFGKTTWHSVIKEDNGQIIYTSQDYSSLQKAVQTATRFGAATGINITTVEMRA
jgi:uncharacterized protein YegP (UPF0339 family)